jgi:hypothetical protein
MFNLERKYDELISLYNDIKEHVRRTDKRQYERWKAGGFCVDDDIMSMYPSLGQVVERLTADEGEGD